MIPHTAIFADHYIFANCDSTMMDQSGNFRLIARYNWRSARYIDLSPDI